jgi:hypothetical protein
MEQTRKQSLNRLTVNSSLKLEVYRIETRVPFHRLLLHQDLSPALAVALQPQPLVFGVVCRRQTLLEPLLSLSAPMIKTSDTCIFIRNFV